ncbi:MAG: type I restriction-modification system subunit M [Deltaproteobacteria bacterium]|nr:type I restriction-modification system subunit M [Deltaproteobacteria bacterium]
MANNGKIKELANFIWSIANLLRGDYKQSDYGKIILPFTVLRRLDCVLEPTKQKVLNYLPKLKSMKIKNTEPVLNKVAGFNFHNKSKLDIEKLKADPDNIAANLRNYINGFSAGGREIIECFSFNDQITRLDEANLLFLIVSRFSEVDLHPDNVSSIEMGYVFEELIRKFSELSNETAGEHFTPREVIRLMVNILFLNDKEILTKKGIVKTIYDPACGTGGMLSVAENYLRELNPRARLEVFGQEVNPESYAICKSDMLIKGENTANIKFGNSFTMDGLESEKFDYMLSNPPFGVEWKKVQTHVKKEHEVKGYGGRFGAGLPRISDGSFLFLQHMISKMKPTNSGTRLGIVFNGSPLFSGGAGSGESEIRKWIIENDMLESIIAMPDQLFYNTGIFTYIWILTNRKPVKRKGKIQVVNAVSFFEKMSRSLGNKRNEISDKQINEITGIYGNFIEGECCRIFDNEDFGYNRITVERPLRLNFQTSEERIALLENEKAFQNLSRPKKKGKTGLKQKEEGEKLQQDILAMINNMDGSVIYKNRDKFEEVLKEHCRKYGLSLPAPMQKTVLRALSKQDETADICLDKKGNPEPDTALRDNENVPLKEDIREYFDREVLPHVPDAWIDESKTVKGYEINITKYFYKYKPLRPLADIRADILALKQETEGMIQEVLEG